MAKPKYLLITRFMNLADKSIPTKLIQAFVEFMEKFLPPRQGDQVEQLGVEHTEPWRHVAWLTTTDTAGELSGLDDVMNFLGAYDTLYDEPISTEFTERHIRDLRAPPWGFLNAEFLEPMNDALCKSGWRLKKYELVDDPRTPSVKADRLIYEYKDIRLEMFYFKFDSRLH